MTVPPAFFDDGHDGTWADALRFPHSIRILHDAPCQFTETGWDERTPFANRRPLHCPGPFGRFPLHAITETDRAAQSLDTAPRREVADSSLRIAHPARVVLPLHNAGDSE